MDTNTSKTAHDSTAYFAMKGKDANDVFVIKLVTKQQIEHARAILVGSEKKRIHIQGTVIPKGFPTTPSGTFISTL